MGKNIEQYGKLSESLLGKFIAEIQFKMNYFEQVKHLDEHQIKLTKQEVAFSQKQKEFITKSLELIQNLLNIFDEGKEPNRVTVYMHKDHLASFKDKSVHLLFNLEAYFLTKVGPDLIKKIIEESIKNAKGIQIEQIQLDLRKKISASLDDQILAQVPHYHKEQAVNNLDMYISLIINSDCFKACKNNQDRADQLFASLWERVLNKPYQLRIYDLALYELLVEISMMLDDLPTDIGKMADFLNPDALHFKGLSTRVASQKGQSQYVYDIAGTGVVDFNAEYQYTILPLIKDIIYQAIDEFEQRNANAEYIVLHQELVDGCEQIVYKQKALLDAKLLKAEAVLTFDDKDLLDQFKDKLIQLQETRSMLEMTIAQYQKTKKQISFEWVCQQLPDGFQRLKEMHKERADISFMIRRLQKHYSVQSEANDLFIKVGLENLMRKIPTAEKDVIARVNSKIIEQLNEFDHVIEMNRAVEIDRPDSNMDSIALVEHYQRSLQINEAKKKQLADLDVITNRLDRVLEGNEPYLKALSDRFLSSKKMLATVSQELQKQEGVLIDLLKKAQARKLEEDELKQAGLNDISHLIDDNAQKLEKASLKHQELDKSYLESMNIYEALVEQEQKRNQLMQDLKSHVKAFHGLINTIDLKNDAFWRGDLTLKDVEDYSVSSIEKMKEYDLELESIKSLEDPLEIAKKLKAIEAVIQCCESSQEKNSLPIEQLEILPQLGGKNGLEYLQTNIMGLRNPIISMANQFLFKLSTSSNLFGNFIGDLNENVQIIADFQRVLFEKQEYFEKRLILAQYWEKKQDLKQKQAEISSVILKIKEGFSLDEHASEIYKANSLDVIALQKEETLEAIQKLQAEQKILKKMGDLYKTIEQFKELADKDILNIEEISSYKALYQTCQQQFKELKSLEASAPLFEQQIQAFEKIVVQLQSDYKNHFHEERKALNADYQVLHSESEALKLSIERVIQPVSLIAASHILTLYNRVGNRLNQLSERASVIPEPGIGLNEILNNEVNQFVCDMVESMLARVTQDLSQVPSDFLLGEEDKELDVLNSKLAQLSEISNLLEQYPKDALISFLTESDKTEELKSVIENHVKLSQIVALNNPKAQEMNACNQRRVTMIGEHLAHLNAYKCKQVKRAQYIASLKLQLQSYQQTGIIDGLLELLIVEGQKHKGLHFQPILRRLILAVKNHEQSIQLPHDGAQRNHEVSDNLEVENAEVSSLKEAIAQLSQHANTLPEKEQQVARDLALGLNLRVDEFTRFWKGKEVPQEVFKTFYQDFKIHLHSQDDVMSIHRKIWKPVLVNILAAVFSLGIALGIQLARTRKNDGYAHLFFDTKRITLVNKIDQVFEEAYSQGHRS